MIMKKIKRYKWKTFISYSELIKFLDNLLQQNLNIRRVILFTDKMMPGISGNELIEIIRDMCEQNGIESYE